MELLGYLALFIVSLAVLLKASDYFVEGAREIGISLGISPFVIGVTIVALGTSLPELATSISAVFSGSSEIVVGNVVGSNITNILLVLGLAALVGKRIVMDYNIMDIDMPLLLISSILLFITLLDGHLSLFESLLFIGAFGIFIVNSLSGKREDISMEEKASYKSYLMLIIGGLFVWLGSVYTVVGIKELSLEIGIPSDLFAVSIVALGTSLPEVVVSVTAARKGHSAIAVGNVLGSNVFNTYLVMGIPAMMGDLSISGEFISYHIPFMIAVTVIFAIISLSNRISKWEGMMLLIFYIYYMTEIYSRAAVAG